MLFLYISPIKTFTGLNENVNNIPERGPERINNVIKGHRF